MGCAGPSYPPFPEIPVKCLMRLQFSVLIKRKPLMTFVNVDKHYLKGAMDRSRDHSCGGLAIEERGWALPQLTKDEWTQAEDQHLGRN